MDEDNFSLDSYIQSPFKNNSKISRERNLNFSRYNDKNQSKYGKTERIYKERRERDSIDNKKRESHRFSPIRSRSRDRDISNQNRESLQQKKMYQNKNQIEQNRSFKYEYDKNEDNNKERYYSHRFSPMRSRSREKDQEKLDRLKQQLQKQDDSDDNEDQYEQLERVDWKFYEQDGSKDKKKSDQELQDLLKDLRNEVSFILKPDDRRQKYERTRIWELKKDIIHWGQRKLLMSEIWFLTQFGELANTVVYAGAAPGCHISLLAEMFPQHKFILVDPSPFNVRKGILEEKDFEERIIIIKDYFTDKLALEMKEKYGDILFVSDIGTADTSIEIDNYQEKTKEEIRQIIIEKKEKVEKMVKLDNEWQMNWCRIMNAKKALLKFRCPYPSRSLGNQDFYYMDGIIYMQPWCAPTSTESRLVPSDYNNLILYDNVKYEEQFYYHNHNVRVLNPIKSQKVKGEGLKKNWDSAVEVIILGEFLIKYRNFMEDGYSFYASISKLSYYISRNCGFGDSKRTLASQMKPPEQRKQYERRDHTLFHGEKLRK
ncbi:hypothetical protein PPERSA_03858 [Pseudocohnilembus persalinus]|uniref:Cap-specific mRNA (nucleoside-2'-O-)-methyltransferase n=1 Tax=Pseudocohnilembus persalinus TaxID=266149 RepID=A0A0V0QUK7_PSEPJ|nr:hypothetical protein PPERSA_03858 [Pseudocohnilembus persalinus]|eukprot:KRX05921.1 hypothetical protein PPERSA_03858 [Pseudocohnilembus persalinus]